TSGAVWPQGAGVWFGPYGGTNELGHAKELRAAVPDHSLTVLDRGFLAASMLLGIARAGRIATG
ncbi:MAG TPA: hypothetical protein VLT33_38375, partial [Labilithrix sp.]|nr:hypothetical protein [Labilithrix sp.]